MWPVVLALLGSLRSALRGRGDLVLENLALRQQLALLHHRSKRLARVTNYPRSIWVCHSSVLPQLAALAGTYYAAAGPGPFGAVLGRPLYVSEHMNVVGDAGDIALVDPAAHLVALRGPTNSGPAVSFAFDQDLESFRAVVDLGSAPLLAGTVTRRSGTDTLASVVTLAERGA